MGLKTFFAKMIGRKVSAELKLEEGKVDDKKPWYKSKSVLSGVLAVAVVVYNAAREPLGANFGTNLPPIPEWLIAFLSGVGVYGRVTADKKIG